MEKINWENGQLVSNAYVTIDGTDYPIVPKVMEGATPLSAENLNLMQQNIEDAISPLLDYISKRHKVLWTGTWGSGSITVEGANQYHSFIVYVDNSQDPIVCYRDNTGKIMGSVGSGSSSAGNQYIKVFRASISDNTFTWEYAKEITHNASGNHGAASNKTVYKIVGLDPVLE